MNDNSSKTELLSITAKIVAAHISRSPVSTGGLSALIRSVHAAPSSVRVPTAEAAKPDPAVPVKRSVFPDYLVCLEDGKKLKTLKRHLRVAFNLTPEQYRERWDLPHGYPMVAPNYANQRSALAKEFGLGRKPVSPKVPLEPAKTRGRKPRLVATGT